MEEVNTPDTSKPAISQPKPKGFGLLAQDIAGVVTKGREKLQALSKKRIDTTQLTKDVETVQNYAETHEFNTELFLSDLLYAGILAGTSAHNILQKIQDGSIFTPDAVRETKERDYPKVEMVTYGDQRVIDKFRGDEPFTDGEQGVVVNLGGAQGGGNGISG